jgi:hypothetical protein
MAASSLRRWVPWVACAWAAASGCAAPPPPVARTEAATEQPSTAKPPAAEPAAAAAQPGPTAATPAPPAASAADHSADPATTDKQGTADVVEPGGEPGTQSLVQAAKAERERRAHAGAPVAVITDKTLPHLPKGKVTSADPTKKKSQDSQPSPAATAGARDEQYWRSRALEIRTRWKQGADAVKDLELSAAGWRRRFYAEDDPYVRDGQIKPEWDRVLDRLGKAREEVEAAKRELTDFLDEGRRAGALPGWLREGAELEPVDKPKAKEPGTVEPKEPPIYQQNDGGI